jgi:hypothetical protein
MVLDSPMTGQAFLAYVQQVLIPTLKPGGIVALDNLPAHKIAAVRAAIEARGAQFFLLPPYSPDMNPIEMVFANSRRCCAKLPSAPATACVTASATCSTASPQTNTLTIFEPPAMPSHTL